MTHLPTLGNFLAQKWPLNGYVQYPGFSELYVRKGDKFVFFENGQSSKCERMLQIARMEAEQPRRGAFTRLVQFLVQRDLAIFVEHLYNEPFQSKLVDLGFTPVNINMGAPSFLFNYEGHLIDN